MRAAVEACARILEGAARLRGYSGFAGQQMRVGLSRAVWARRNAPAVRLWECDAYHGADEGRQEEVREELGVRVKVVAEGQEEEDKDHLLNGPVDRSGLVRIRSQSVQE